MDTKEKLYLLMLKNEKEVDSEASFINLNFGITSIEDAEKHFAAEYYIGIVKKYKKRLNLEFESLSEGGRKELLYSMKKIAMEYKTYSPKEFLALHNLFVVERI